MKKNLFIGLRKKSFYKLEHKHFFKFTNLLLNRVYTVLIDVFCHYSIGVELLEFLGKKLKLIIFAGLF